MDKYQNKYRIQSHRMPQWDYSENGIYFITLVTQNRECNLGEIIRRKMILSDFGKIVNDEWISSFKIRNELFLDEYVIMPNHLHAIVILDNPHVFDDRDDDGRNGDDRNEIDRIDRIDRIIVETHGRASLRRQSTNQSTNQFPNNNSPEQSQQSSISPTGQSIKKSTEQLDKQLQLIRKPKSISSFIAGFKSSINSKIDDYIDEYHLNIPKYNRNNHFFQPNYHDHIIRNETEFQRIKKYIINNPMKWSNDKFNL